MARPYGGRPTCEICQSIDVRRWHREGRLQAGQWFPYSWTCGGEPSGSIGVRTETDTVVLSFRSRSLESAEWKSVEQRVPIVWTTRGEALPWRLRRFRMSALLRFGLCKSTRILAPPRAWKGTENPHGIGREREHAR